MDNHQIEAIEGGRLIKNQRVAELERKRRCAEKAHESVEKEILETDTFTEEKALSLASLYAGYLLEEDFHCADRYSAEIELSSSELFRSSREEDFKAIKERSLEIEASLFDAQNGDYRKLKEWLNFEADSIEDEEEELGKKIKIMANLIPDYGKPVVLPTPAWMDPRFVESGDS